VDERNLHCANRNRRVLNGLIVHLDSNGELGQSAGKLYAMHGKFRGIGAPKALTACAIHVATIGDSSMCSMASYGLLRHERDGGAGWSG
jgi:hypothetical protein